jgi:uridylate kinase
MTKVTNVFNQDPNKHAGAADLRRMREDAGVDGLRQKGGIPDVSEV